MIPSTAVVHLVRAVNGPAPFEAFARSYDHHDSGAEHDLVLLLKGFEGERAVMRPYLERAAAWAPRVLEVSDTGSDVAAYQEAGRRLEHQRVCFLNSFSVLAAGEWLAHLESALEQPGVGAVGATGSWGSHLSYNLFQAGWSGRYARSFAGRREARQAMHALSGTAVRGVPAEMAYAGLQALRDAPAMPCFPAAHLRTNAFLVDRHRFLGLRLGAARDKRAAYRFESGRQGLTAQLRAAGRSVAIVDRHGHPHGENAWDRADVFWQAAQEMLLVQDNQTRSYAAASPEEQRALSAFAWGTRARPGAEADD